MYKIEKHQILKYVRFEQKMKKCVFWCLLSKGILAGAASTIYMALWNYLNSETLGFILNGLEKVSQNFERCVCGTAPKVPETGSTLSLTLLVKAQALAIL